MNLLRMSTVEFKQRQFYVDTNVVEAPLNQVQMHRKMKHHVAAIQFEIKLYGGDFLGSTSDTSTKHFAQ